MGGLGRGPGTTGEAGLHGVHRRAGAVLVGRLLGAQFWAAGTWFAFITAEGPRAFHGLRGAQPPSARVFWRSGSHGEVCHAPSRLLGLSSQIPYPSLGVFSL